MSNIEDIARPYQLRLLKRSIERNSIIYLPTGSGKTYIAIMLIKYFSEDCEKKLSEGGKRCIMMCNTVELARQSAFEISNATNLIPSLLTGDLNIDNWKPEKWDQVLNNAQVLVGTSQVFVDILSRQYITIKNLSCIIMDECHHATKLHPMIQFLSLLPQTSSTDLPRVVGLTGVLIKSVKKNDVIGPLISLETAIRGEIITVANVDEYYNVLIYSTAPKEDLLVYGPSEKYPVQKVVENIIDECLKKLEKIEWSQRKTLSKNLLQERDCTPKKYMKALLKDFLYQMDDLGIYTANIAIMGTIVQMEINRRNTELIALKTIYRYIIGQCERILHLLTREINSWKSILPDSSPRNLIYKLSTTKLQCLLIYLEREFGNIDPNDYSCLIFVTRRNTAKYLFYLLKDFTSHCSNLKNVQPDFIVGRNASIVYTISSILEEKWNKKVLEKFRRKERNMLVCSNVLEEGIDIQSCNYVISFDGANHFSSYVQMKGRARSQDSHFTVLAQKDDTVKVSKQISHYREIDKKVKEYLEKRIIDHAPGEASSPERFPVIIPPLITKCGAILKAEAAVKLMHQYCQSLPRDVYTQPTVTWSLIQSGSGTCQVSCQLPIQSPIKNAISSAIMKSIKHAKMSAAMKVCAQLYEIGELTENLLPTESKELIENVSEIYFAKWKHEEKESSKTAGTKKRFRNYEKLCPKELYAAWPVVGKTSYAYCLKFTPKFPKSDFIDEHVETVRKLLQSKLTYAFVLTHELPAIAPTQLFMTQGPVDVEISKEPITFKITTQEQLDKLKVFTKTIFSDIMPKCWQQFLVIDHRNNVNSALIAPLTNDGSIDWGIIYTFQQIKPVKPLEPADLLGKVVNSCYRPETRYVVTKIREDLNPLSEFPSTTYDNFSAYFKDKYDQVVHNNKQALIEVQQFTSRTNFFINAAGKSIAQKRAQTDTVILIPELCGNFQYPGELWLKALLLPSIIHRLHYSLHAENLRNEINNYLGIKATTQYQPKAVQIDPSLRRVSHGDDSEEYRKMLPLLDTTRPDDSNQGEENCIDSAKGLWKAHMEPDDINRKFTNIYPIEIDYFHAFINSNSIVGNDVDQSLNEQQYREGIFFDNLLTHRPKNTTSKDTPCLPSIADVPGSSGRKINILSKSNDTITSAEQYEFLAAITTASSSDVFDMERFEVLGDSFLKFSTSLLLMHQHSKWNEGKLTAVKSQMVSNRNLLYCMRAKFSGSFICSTRFDPTVEWLPPNSSVPLNILNGGLSDEQLGRCLLEIELSESEVLSGVCHQDTLKKALHSANTSESTVDALNEFLYVQSISDKTVADCLEALLGVCVKNYGIRKSFEMLDYFGIFYDPKKTILPNLLSINLGSPLLKSTAKQFEIDQHLKNYSILESNIAYKFKDRAYLLQALTHPSYPTNRITGCYQELEFIGDAILDFLMTCYIYERCSYMNPGKITDLRSALVNNVTLACVSVRNRLHKFLLHESPALATALNNFVSFQNTQDHIVTNQVRILLEESDQVGSYNLAQNIDVPKALGDVFEAIVGAIFLDSGNDLPTTWNVITHLMDIELNQFIQNVPLNPVRELHEYRGANPKFHVDILEPDVCLMKCDFVCRDLIKTVHGGGKNKSKAKVSAAKMALQILHNS